jgi:hypothetical protein
MARIHGPLHPAPANRLEHELAALFGGELLERAKATDPANLELSAELMDTVHGAADSLLGRAGEPLAQRAIVAALPADVRLVLCMWIHDLDLAVKLTAAVIGRAA